MIVGFGTFETKKRRKRSGFNPAKKEKSIIEEANMPVFKPSLNLEEKVKKGE